MKSLDIPSVNSDPAFIAIGKHFQDTQRRRLAVLKERYGIQGHVSLGGNYRLKFGLCNISSSDMFDNDRPKIGDIVVLGHLYGCDSAEVLIGRLAKHFSDPATQPRPDLSGYRFAWQVDPITGYSFPPEEGGRDYRQDKGSPEGEIPMDVTHLVI